VPSENHPIALPLHDAAVHLDPQDEVAIAKTDLLAGTVLTLESGEGPSMQVTLRQPVPSGHKIALREMTAGQPVHRYGQVIGSASRAIRPGEHVHTHNLGSEGFEREYAFGVDVEPVTLVPEGERRTFLGYRREGGGVGTRNYVAVISTVNCAAHTSREIARYFTPERLAGYPNVDGVIALTHASGCSIRKDGPDYVWLQRALAGMARHPNVAAAIFVGLGCEVNQFTDLARNYDLERPGQGSPPSLIIQDLGGMRRTVQAGIKLIEAMLPEVNAVARTPQPISELMLALQCGGSDGWSGVTANPVLGLVADEVVRQGGTVVLGETPEIYGAEHLLTRRAVSPEVGRKLVEKVHWWETHTRQFGTQIDNNPTPGNKAGGLTTIYEKALGAITKSGRTPLMGVYDYAERVMARGFTFMDSPGNDWMAVTGQVAGGCNLVLFTTGRGSVFGFKPAPSIKIASNAATFERMRDDMDLNAGKVLEGVGLEEVAAKLLELVIDVASGQASKSEAQGVGEEEFNPWRYGETV
jgi:altronate hydrolase